MAISDHHPEALPEWLEYVEHTADTGIRVWGPDAAAVLSRAAWGFFSLLVDPATVRRARCAVAGGLAVGAESPASD